MPDNLFEKKYIACRTRENRMYTDEEVSRLPECRASHPHSSEWQLRKASARRLTAYLEKKRQPLNILEIGCGNGWLCHQLSLISRSKLTGLDINFTELQQAARVFNSCPKMKFIYGDIRSGILDDRQYDMIVFAASIQYFESIDSILDLCLRHLKPNGEIHITDTRFYSAKEVSAAAGRTETYYRSIGFPEMARHYFHHTVNSLAQFNSTVLYDPASIWNRLSGNHFPFHWIRINKD